MEQLTDYKNQKMYTLVWVVVVFFLVVFGIIYFWGPKDRVNTPAPEDRVNTEVPTTATSTEQPTRRPLSEVIGEMMYAPHVDPDGRFTFEYPLGWDVVQNPGGGAVVIVKNRVSDRVSETTTVKADIAVLGGTVRTGTTKTCAEFKPVDLQVLSCTEVTVSGIPSLLIDLETPLGIGDAMMHNRQLLVVSEQVGIAIQARAYTGAWQQYDQMFTRVLGSFRLLP
ncbi:hypothetical protein HY624_03970 [Candidatus Uhrbacteria bacterium]|nr:hypothetical protein [Candidatus Uhrbacteria bacterium]